MRTVTMGQFEDLKLFITIIDEGSIARAAKALGIAKSAVSRRLSQLEDRYDIRLIDRHPGTWEVTQAGQELYQRAVPMIAEASDLEADFIHTSQSLNGPLRVSLPREFGMSFLRPALYDFIQDHPEIDLTVDFEDRTVDLENENYDLAIRITSEVLGGLNMMRLGSTRHGLYASPSYLKAAGSLNTPADLKAHRLLHYGADRRAVWEFGFRGQKAKVEFKPDLGSNAGAFLLDAAVNDFGIIRLPDFVVADAVRENALTQLLPEAEFQEYGVFLVTSSKRRINKRMRAFISSLEARCADLCP
ncbi:LysR family transcriptional regulator [Aliiroseovarius marinus]|uniref:LysR family transcriptional regulator n=1 Tax=Aliiroseovarius marinus TaxID=2500159 RepID=UPI0024958D05|nr:LysR family transcriptional regulator [Aliiroseovarius marinus]